MNCEQCQSLIDDAVDGDIAAADRARLDAHVRRCAACQAALEDFRAIRSAARGLERHVPPPRIWTRVSESVAAERRQPRWLFTWQPLAIAATLMVIVGGTSLMVWRQMSSTPPSRAVTTSGPPAAANPELLVSVETELRLAEEHYQKAIAGLEQITRTESAELPPQVSAVLYKNLEVIDQAIGESRAALQAQPTSDVAQESLFEALRNKVMLLQNTVVLINEMRQGNQEGAARVVSGLNQ